VFLADRVAVMRDGRLVKVVESGRTGRVSAYTDGLEAELRALLGEGDSTRVREPRARRGPAVLAPVAAILLGLLGWQLLAGVLAQPFLLPAPLTVWRELVTNWGELSAQLLTTLRTAVLGAVAGGVLGTAFGYPLGKLPWLERFLSPFVVASQSTPTIVLAPLLITWLGFGYLPGVVVAALSAFYPVMVATLVGVRGVERTYHELFDTLGATFVQRMTLLELPHALPIILGGLRLAASLALIGAVVWEFVSNQPGLGYAVNQARAYYNTPRQFAAIALLVLLGVVVYGAVTALERRALNHRERQ
jgi:NitT/TauT family transport system ATP-binding protein